MKHHHALMMPAQPAQGECRRKHKYNELADLMGAQEGSKSPSGAHGLRLLRNRTLQHGINMWVAIRFLAGA